MRNGFSKEDQQKFLFRKHIKDHLFEYILDFIGPVILTVFILHLCGAEKFIYGIVLSLAYSCGRVAYTLHHYKKVHINADMN